MLTAFFRFIYLPACDAVARAKEHIAIARGRAYREREQAAYERRILRDHGPVMLKIVRYRHMTPEERGALTPEQMAEYESALAYQGALVRARQ